MECFFINMDSQPERRDFLQRNFAQYKAPGWFLSRIQAADPAYIRSHSIPGTIRDAEKGCFVSHQFTLRESLGAPGHAFVLEDDAMFGPNACAAIEGAIAQMPADGWDLLFTDTSIYYLPLILALMQQRRQAGAEGGQVLVNMNEIAFCGSTAYVVNERSKERVLELISPASLDEPYDVFLRRLVRAEKIRAFVTLPFATTLSALGDESSIQESHAERERVALNAFRRLAWVDRDIAAINQSLDRIDPALLTPEAATLARITGLTYALQGPGLEKQD